MDLFSLLDINNTLVNIPIGGGYAMSWVEGFGTIFGLLCIWFASQEKTINYVFGLLNVTLFAVIFFQIQLYGLLLLQLFFFCANIYGWYAWTKPNSSGETLEVRWLSKSKLLAISGVRSHDSFYTDEEEQLCQYWNKKGILGADMETSALFTVGRLRGLQVASILNNVVLYQQDVKEGVNQYVNDNAAMMNGERLAAITALEALCKQGA
nr:MULTISPECIES: nicotinamide riboside transporter PnuC [unclassified Aliivibrio]